MKKITLLAGLLLSVQILIAQDKFKFGTVPEGLLEMTVYDNDSTASAFVVYENNDVYYDWNSARKNENCPSNSITPKMTASISILPFRQDTH